MSFTLLSVFILLLFGMITFIEVRNGIKRGLRLSLISLGSSVLSLLLSFPVTLAVAEATAGWLMELLKENEDYENLLAYLPSVELVLPPILSMALCAVLFLAVFLTLLFAVKKTAFLICRKCAKRREDDPGYGEDSPECASRQSRAMGAACGMLAAIVLTVAVLSPLMGILEFADDALNIVKQIDTEIYESLGTGNAEMVHSFTEDPLGKLFYRGAGFWLAAVTGADALVQGRLCLEPDRRTRLPFIRATRDEWNYLAASGIMIGIVLLLIFPAIASFGAMVVVWVWFWRELPGAGELEGGLTSQWITMYGFWAAVVTLLCGMGLL